MNHSQEEEEEGIVPLSAASEIEFRLRTTFPGSSGIQQHITPLWVLLTLPDHERLLLLLLTRVPALVLMLCYSASYILK